MNLRLTTKRRPQATGPLLRPLPCHLSLLPYWRSRIPSMALEFVGWDSAEGATTAFDVELDALFGGSDVAAQAGDLVLVINAHDDLVDTNPGTTTAGYTELFDLYISDSRDAGL